MGKGVRTVQRWERTLGLPVRRAARNGSKSSLMVDTSELEMWMRATFEPAQVAEVKLDWDLIKRSKELVKESLPLREEHSQLVQQAHRAVMDLQESRVTAQFLRVRLLEQVPHRQLSVQ
jgi:hypothetical protein